MPTDWDVDVRLLERWRDGDTQAVEQLLARHGDSVVRFFRNKLSRSDEIEDLVQQTFLRLLERRQHIIAGVALRGYILGIAYNLWREKIRTTRGDTLDFDVDATASLMPGPSTIIGRKQEHRLLVEALRHIPLQSQVELELFYWEGLKANEIAELVGVSHSAMRSRLARARAQLKTKILELGQSAKLVETTLSALDHWADELAGMMASDDGVEVDVDADTDA